VFLKKNYYFCTFKKINSFYFTAISQVQLWLEALHDKRRNIDKKWTFQKSTMEQAIQMAVLTQELISLDELLKVRHEGMARCDQLGDSTLSAEFLLTEHHKLLPEAKARNIFLFWKMTFC